jgi:hypothetical protein
MSYNNQIINKSNFLTYLNTENSYECHNIIFNILKIYNIPYSKNNNGIFINYNNLNDNIINIISNYINDYIKKKKINISINNKNKQMIQLNNINTFFYIPLSNEQIEHYNKFQELILLHNYKKHIRPPIIKKKYNCKNNNNNSFENTCNMITVDKYLL